MSESPHFSAQDVYDLATVSGIHDYSIIADQERYCYQIASKAFLVINQHTIEVRTDRELAKLLKAKYESVMDSRYFGRGGVEIVIAGQQLTKTELDDLVRLSYNLTATRPR